MEVKTWYDVVVEQILEDSKVNILISKLKYNLYSFQTYFIIRVDGEVKHKVENPTPMTFSDVEVYSGLTDTAQWSGPYADAIIRNLKFVNL